MMKLIKGLFIFNLGFAAALVFIHWLIGTDAFVKFAVEKVEESLKKEGLKVVKDGKETKDESNEE